MTFLGLTLDKLIVIGVIAAIILGPERLPAAAERLAGLVRGIRDLANGAKDRMREEMGPEFDDVDWRKLDPRQYDPRRIVREALMDDAPKAAAAASTVAATAAAGRARRRTTPRDPLPDGAPYDVEAT
ncbi:Sec-independent protein translocase family protein [Agrococcus jejuensis]|uniref:Sec-independent protein translocase protein TatB n=1 Tax=Agrococcus jejuensis TaxID=399736 RepID=A0A1G8G6Y3_9MICO|nr:Sec-independent protein translocase TatB [Agrococcus jejuensis]SDH90165.1 sec-independent protein translocase protein TatB [Agrococcus jejuensis]